MKRLLLLAFLSSCTPTNTTPSPNLLFPGGSIGAVVRCEDRFACVKAATQMCSTGYDLLKEDKPQSYTPYYWFLVRCW